jgi:hypothetical protein
MVNLSNIWSVGFGVGEAVDFACDGGEPVLVDEPVLRLLRGMTGI